MSKIPMEEYGGTKSNGKSVLIIAYYFPPSGGPGVQRVLNYIKFLPDFGWNPIVLTVADGDFPARDETLYSEIPDTVPIIRTPIWEPYRLYRRLRRLPPEAPVDVNVLSKNNRKDPLSWLISKIRETFFIPDARIGWYPFALSAARRLVRRFPIAALYTSAPPYTTALIGLRLHQKTGLPWIAGFRDPWTGFLSTPRRWILPRRFEQWLEHRVLQQAQRIECAWPGIVEDFRTKYPDIAESKFVVIPNGFHPTVSRPVPYQPNPQFTITYVGSLYGHRDPSPLLQACQQLLDQKRIEREHCLLQIVGRIGEEIRQQLQHAPIPVKTIPYVPFRESIQFMQHSELLLLLIDNSPHSRKIVPGKFFEYLAVHRPILAIGPLQSEVQSILHQTRAGIIHPPTDITAIANTIATFYEAWRSERMHTFLQQINTEAIQQYNRYRLTQRFAHLLDTVVQHSPKR